MLDKITSQTGLSGVESDVTVAQLSSAMASSSLSHHQEGSSFYQIPFRLDVPLVDHSTLPKLHPVTVEIQYDPTVVQAASTTETSTTASFDHPIKASNISFQTITAPEAVKAVQLVSFDVEDERWSCQAGDAFGLFCENSPDSIERLFTALDLDGDQLIALTPLIPTKPETFLKAVEGQVLSLQRIFRHYADITHFPKKSLLRHLAEFCTNLLEKNYLLHLCSKPGSADYMALANSHVSVLDFLCSLSSCRPSLECLFSHLPLLHPRYFSVCSASQDARVQFIYSTMSYTMPDGSSRSGVCTAWLNRCARVDPKDLVFTVFPRPAPHFRLPDDPNTPVVMICAGTGLSPFIGFLRSLRHSPHQRSMLWLFCGFRDRNHDFLFREEIEEYLQTGTLTRLNVAISREAGSDAPKYVQHALQMHSTEIYRLMDVSDGRIYICGDELTMIKDVNRAILACIAKEGNMSDKEAESRLQVWNANKRIVRDIWV